MIRKEQPFSILLRKTEKGCHWQVTVRAESIGGGTSTTMFQALHEAKDWVSKNQKILSHESQ